MSFSIAANDRPQVYWVDEDRYFVEANAFVFELEGLDVLHFPDATSAYGALCDPAQIKRGVILVDVMLAPGADEVLFSANEDFSEEEMGLLLVDRLSRQGLSPSVFPYLVCTSRAYGGFRRRVEKFCGSRGANLITKTTDVSSKDITQFVREIYAAFPWDQS